MIYSKYTELTLKHWQVFRKGHCLKVKVKMEIQLWEDQVDLTIQITHLDQPKIHFKNNS